MIAERDINGEGKLDRKAFGIRFQEHYYMPLLIQIGGVTFDAMMKMLKEIREIYEYCANWRMKMR